MHSCVLDGHHVVVDRELPDEDADIHVIDGVHYVNDHVVSTLPVEPFDVVAQVAGQT